MGKNWKEYQNWRKARKNQQRTFARPSATGAQMVTKSRILVSEARMPCKLERKIVTQQTLESRATIQDLLERHNFSRDANGWM